MKTLLFTLEFPLPDQSPGQAFYGGVANYYGNLVKYWPKSDNIFVLNNNDNKLIKRWLWPKWLPTIWHLWRGVKKEKINYILVGHILPLGTATWILSKFIGFRYGVILHGMDFTYASRIARKKWIIKKILKKADKIICVNSYLAGLVRDFLSREQAGKIIIVNPGIEVRSKKLSPPWRDPTEAGEVKSKKDLLKEKYNLKNKIVLFSIGRLVKRKGFDKVIAAMPKVLKQVQNLVYAIAGDGPDKNYLEKLAKDKKDIIFLGKITDEEKWVWLNLCDIFIMPSRQIKEDFEGFGIVYLEANLCSKPVIAGDSGGVRDAVKNGINGLLVNSENIEEITEAVIKLAKDKNLREKLGRQGKERVIKEFNWEKQTKKIISKL